METIKIYELDSMSLSRSQRLNSDLRITISPLSDDRIGSRLMTFKYENEALINGFSKMNFAENTLTGDIYIILSKNKGLQLKQRVGRQGYVCTKNSVIDLFVKMIGLELKSQRVDITFSENLSKSIDQFTYKIENINKI